MPSLLLVRQASGGGLGLGWLLAIAIGGGVLIFTAVGLLLAWRLKMRAKPYMRRVYALDPMPGQPNSTTRLAKRSRSMLTSDLSTSRFSSRLSISLPPVPLLPPLPSYNSIRTLSGTGGRGRSKSWVDEDAIHGPQMGQKARDSWFRSDSSVFGFRSPTMPNLDAAEQGKMEAAISAPAAQTEEKKDSTEEQKIEVVKRQSRALIKGSQTVPVLPSRDDAQRGRARVPAQSHVKASATDTGLKDILRSTEQRLRGATSESPVKTPKSSPVRGGSPTKTPGSCRTGSSQGTVRVSRSNRSTPSPSKREDDNIPPRPHTRNGSVDSIGGTTSIRMVEVECRLQLPGVQLSPTRQYGRDWERSRQQNGQDSPQSSPRRFSMSSDASSSLSTLYSVSEPDESSRSPHGFSASNDPFMDNRVSVPQSLSLRDSPAVSGPRPMRRMDRALSVASLSKVVDESAIPAPLRPKSANKQIGPRRDMTRPSKLSLILEPPSRPQSGDIGAKTPTLSRPSSIVHTSSETSMVTERVHTETHAESQTGGTPKSHKQLRPEESSSSPITSSTPDREDRSTDVSSSPLNEHDLLTILLSSNLPKRALPMPPTPSTAADGTIIATPLSPPPESKSGSPLRRMSIASSSSSNYDPDSTGPPPESDSPVVLSRHSTVKSMREEQPVGSTISQLRKMDSMVSSYSVASITSTLMGDADSPSLPSLKSGNLTVPKSTSRSGDIRNYYNMGQKHTKNKTHNRNNSSRNHNTVAQHSEAKEGPGKENQGLGLRMPRIDVTTASSPASSRQESPQRVQKQRRDSPKHHNRMKRGLIGDLTAEERGQGGQAQRSSVDSLNLYDKDGFLIGSPERDLKGRGFRM